jgi:hypothetical protein
VFFGIVHPEVMALSVGIRSMSAADPLHFVEQGAVSQYRTSQLSPVTPAAAGDYVVYGGEGEAPMVKVSVEHRTSKVLRFQCLEL